MCVWQCLLASIENCILMAISVSNQPKAASSDLWFEHSLADRDLLVAGSGCRDRASYCDRARKLSLCSMQKIKSDCCRTCRDVG